ncbi:MAG: DUF6382 domain-containing protein [Clostridiales bacterium]|nr:DUF6382 domain-containing protein [Clostridiales bacterium]
MKFSFETQGPVTYLSIELDQDEKIDTLTMGMLSNNHIVGFASVLYTEFDGRRFLKYNISAKLTASQFFMGNVPSARVIEGFKSILNAICIADEYMLDTSCFDFDPDHVFINISSCEVAMICIPVNTTKNVNGELINLFKKLMENAGVYDAPDMFKLKDALEAESTFNIYSFKNLVETWTGECPPVNNPAFDPRATFNGTSLGQSVSLPKTGFVPPAAVPPKQEPETRPANEEKKEPVSFDGTLVIDKVVPTNGTSGVPDTRELTMSQKPIAIPGNNTIIGVTNTPNIPTQQPVQGKHVQGIAIPKPVIPPTSVQQPGFSGAPVNPVRPVIPNAAGVQNRPIIPNAPVMPNKPAIPNPPQIPGRPAIPGKPAIPGNNPNGVVPQDQNADNSHKKVSIFGLMAHYSKDNVAEYKEQKKKNKNQKKTAKEQTAASNKKNKKGENKGAPVIPPTGVQTPMGSANGSNGFNIAPTAPANANFQPLGNMNNMSSARPISNPFNETTVLSNSQGETTVLGGADAMTEPYLIRIRTGEKISINKPVFRIGKERSYVDYFILDNTAISRSHANIISSANEYFIEDTNSTNHTFVNGKMINANEKFKLSNGDSIKLANEDFCFCC